LRKRESPKSIGGGNLRIMTQKKSFYVTTPIYYGNGLPHVGHFYSSTIANILYKYHKISWAPARFTTGIDENSQKAVIKAEEAGMDIMEYLDYMAWEHQKTWDYFNIDYTDFVRTTSPRHKKLVQEVLMHCYDVWDIYQDYYEGKYCIGCEAYKKEDELIPHPDPLLRGEGDNMILVCPDHLKEPDVLKEKNYFFRLSKYQTWIFFWDAVTKTLFQSWVRQHDRRSALHECVTLFIEKARYFSFKLNFNENFHRISY